MQDKSSKPIVTRPQIVAVTALSLVALAAGIFIAAIFGNFLMRPGDMQSSGIYSSLDVSGLPEVQASQTVELKNGDTYDLTAGLVKKTINGVSYRMLAYNGSIPGPLVKVTQDAEVTINFKNDTGMKTLLHSHGVRMDNAFDGSQTTQEEMNPGETFSYKLKFPDVGMYWYHPHVREDLQQELGLYGGYLVEPESENYWNTVNRTLPLFLDDVLIEDGNINFSLDAANRTMMGRFGNVMLTNGDTDYSFGVKKGELVRLYVTNVANSRTFNFAIAGAKMKLVGADGGAYEKESWADNVILAPSERAIVEVLFDTPGSYEIQNKTPNITYKLGNITVSSEAVAESYAGQFTTLRSNEDIISSINPLRSMLNRTPDKQIKLTLEMAGMSGMNGMSSMEGMDMSVDKPADGIEWEDSMPDMNTMSNANTTKWKIIDQNTGNEGKSIDWTFKKNEPVKIRIFNDPSAPDAMQHPIHFHGQRFLIVSRDGLSQTDNLVWKDTVLVKAGETVDIILDTSNPGTWMAHCHIAEHLEAGMVFGFKVE